MECADENKTGQFTENVYEGGHGPSPSPCGQLVALSTVQLKALLVLLTGDNESQGLRT